MEYTIDPQRFWHDPYPDLAVMQALASVVYVPQLDAALITRRADVFVQEKRVDIFSSRQPEGLMTRLMGENMMRQDGPAHQAERKQIFPSLSPRTVMQAWRLEFERATQAVIDGLQDKQEFDLVRDFAMPVSGAALVAITGLRQMTPAQMDQVSQAMIDGCANYRGDPSVERACHVATAQIDAHIASMLQEVTVNPDMSVLSVLRQGGQPLANIQANIKLVISGGQNEPRDAIAGTAAAVLMHPDARAYLGQSGAWGQAFMEYVRWMSPIGMSPRQISGDCTVLGYDFKQNDRVFFMFGAANRDSSVFEVPDMYDLNRDTGPAIPFGAGPHFCAGAAASRVLIAEVALPKLFAGFPDLELTEAVRLGVSGSVVGAGPPWWVKACATHS
tara:strand:+ start:541 stop:1704 length:1164 start_codon:yes stop_codon:yes gene_type:complete